MTLKQTLTALVQQMAADGVRITSKNPLAVDGPASVVLQYRGVLAHLRGRAASLETPVDFDQHLAAFETMDLDAAEEALLGHLGRTVWIDDETFIFGRLEAVLPGVALVTPRANPNLPADPVAAFRSRTEQALPFCLHLIAPGDEPIFSAQSIKETAA